MAWGRLADAGRPTWSGRSLMRGDPAVGQRSGPSSRVGPMHDHDWAPEPDGRWFPSVRRESGRLHAGR